MTKKRTPVAKITNIDDVRIGRIIALARDHKRLSQEDLASFIGCDRTTLAGYERGGRPLPANRIPRLVDALGLEPRILDPNAA
ncbi:MULTISPECIES: helix-turn-helix domain-containing protein [Paenarthrobacter]|uniref:Helix-turn-helix domain-containing protein n=1 Tax=Paenarthrobacter ureafaciens TaxID=37931 RepID=A0AAX3EI44_PAEUR|nr:MULTISPECIES: helix-turn-helix transcriptional regulator [Paenarthrobacter]MDO5865985.1 helix-turn-helix domain-containing protein [Paenarthrobacter sp. SD-2]MDO5877080.1 helix-turn-helix domain-containing protein [Paenarthrobacter sp. SD-1]UYV92282.1 helix-turn-helix domain-containing protein [Paenarthrobacter ureafaciens]UYV96817.1 helix-turn-helix domain-containing protein [Paenarthrobacter ureafaciens]WIV32179.1 helix-turn-helix transcriptional regulator [Paenarthrobacter sp. R1]